MTTPLWLSLALALPVAVPDRTAPSFDQEPEKEPIQRLTEWPALEDGGRVETDVKRLRKANTEAMGESAREALVADGAMVAPLLLHALGKEKDGDARGRVLAVLAAVTDARHTRLLAREFEHDSEHVRLFALERVSRFPDPGVRAAAEAVCARLAKAKKPDAKEVYAAALCATTAGSLVGLEALFAEVEGGWSKISKDVRRALEVVRGEAATARVVKHLEAGDRKAKVTALRLLAGCGSKAVASRVAGYLDDPDNSIRVAAINALRGIVDGDPPVEKLAVFDAIERAKKWKERVR